jgi:hypothetical protein
VPRSEVRTLEWLLEMPLVGSKIEAPEPARILEPGFILGSEVETPERLQESPLVVGRIRAPESTRIKEPRFMPGSEVRTPERLLELPLVDGEIGAPGPGKVGGLGSMLGLGVETSERLLELFFVVHNSRALGDFCGITSSHLTTKAALTTSGVAENISQEGFSSLWSDEYGRDEEVPLDYPEGGVGVRYPLETMSS